MVRSGSAYANERRILLLITLETRLRPVSFLISPVVSLHQMHKKKTQQSCVSQTQKGGDWYPIAARAVP